MDSGPIRESIEQVAERLWSARAGDAGSVTVEPLDGGDVEAVASVLVEAARSNPLATAVFGEEGSQPRQALVSLLTARLRLSRAHSQPLFVARARDDGDVVGAAALSRPGFRPPRRHLARLALGRPRAVLATLRAAGTGTVRRIREMRAVPPETSAANYTLGCLGVHPDRQGAGVGTRLLEAVHGFTGDDPASEGVYLVTADETARTICAGHGYETVEVRADERFAVDGDPLRAYHMHRPADV